MSEASPAERALAFMRQVEDAAAARRVPFEWGSALFHDDLRYVYDRNFVRVERGFPSVTALLREADRLQGGAGLLHRRLVFDTGAPEAELRANGFDVGRLALMAALRPPDHDAESAAGELEPEELEEPRREFLRSQPFGGDPETVRQLLANDEILIRVAHGRAFAARAPGGEIAAWCRLYSDGKTFQIEDVATLPRHRGRGLARAVVGAARAAAEAAGAELVFLTARGDDWPQALYAKLGFDPIGSRCDCVRVPGALG